MHGLTGRGPAVAFAPDGEMIVDSAALQGNVPVLFTIRPEYPEPQPLDFPPQTHFLSIFSKGELAVLTNARFVRHRMFIRWIARWPRTRSAFLLHLLLVTGGGLFLQLLLIHRFLAVL